MQGVPFLMIPAFSPAIWQRSFPRNLTWSCEMTEITLARAEGRTLVASYRPPIPTSIKATSAGVLAKARNPALVRISKDVVGCPAFTLSAYSRRSIRAVVSISFPSSTNRSLRRTKWGEVMT